MTQVETDTFVSRPRESERQTRKPISMWDRVKFLLLGGVLFVFFFAAEMADNPLLPASEAFNMTLRGKWWILAFMALELLRQVHYVICEHNAAYYQFWRDKVFGGWNHDGVALRPVEAPPARARVEGHPGLGRAQPDPRAHLRHQLLPRSRTSSSTGSSVSRPPSSRW